MTTQFERDQAAHALKAAKLLRLYDAAQGVLLTFNDTSAELRLAEALAEYAEDVKWARRSVVEEAARVEQATQAAALRQLRLAQSVQLSGPYIDDCAIMVGRGTRWTVFGRCQRKAKWHVALSTLTNRTGEPQNSPLVPADVCTQHHDQWANGEITTYNLWKGDRR